MTTIRKSDGNAKILQEFSSHKNNSFTEPKRVRQEDKTEYKLKPMSCWTFKKGCLLVRSFIRSKYIQALNNSSFENWNMLRWHQSFIHTTKNRLHVEKWFLWKIHIFQSTVWNGRHLFRPNVNDKLDGLLISSFRVA